MSSVEEIIGLLQSTCNQTGEGITEATECLTQARQSEFFFPIILEICKTKTGKIQKAAVIQLQTYLKETERIETLPIEEFIDFYSNSCYEIQYLLQNIAEMISSYFFENEKIEEYFGIVHGLLSEGVSAGFCLLNTFFDDLNADSSIYDSFIPCIIQGLEYIKENIEQNIANKQFQQILNFFYSAAKSIYVGCSFDTYPPQLNSELFSIGNTILSSQIEDLSGMNASILLYFENFFEITETYESVEDYSEVPVAVTTFLSGNAANNARANAYKVLGYFLKNDQLYSTIEDSVVSLFVDFFLPVFVTDINFEEDPQFEIDRIFPSLSDDLSPISAAAKALYDGASKITSTCLEIASIKASEVDAETPASVVYGILFFAGCVAKSFSQSDGEYLSVLLNLASTALESDEAFIIAGCAFLARIPEIEGTDSLICPLLEILIGSSNEIVKYMSAIASTNLISHFQDKEAIGEQLGDSLGDIAQIAFQLGQEFPTEEMAKAIVEFSESFSSYFISSAKEYATMLIEMMSRYMLYESAEASRNTWHFPSAIDAVIKSTVAYPDVCAPVIEQLMTAITELEGSIRNENYEEVLELMRTAISYAPEPLECLSTIPDSMHAIAMAEPMVIETLAPLYRAIALRFPSIAAENAEAFVGTLMVMMDPEEGSAQSEWESARMMLQSLFVVLSEADFAREAVDAIMGQIIECNLPTDSAAALITCNPDVALTEDAVISSWLSDSRPAAFLRSAEVIIGRFSEFAAVIGDREGEMWECVHSSIESLRRLSKKEIDEIDILETPEMDEEKEDLAMFSISELIANPIFNGPQ